MKTKSPHIPEIEENGIVYIRAVKVCDLPGPLRQQAGDAELLYAVHSADGTPLALTGDRDEAFILAELNDFRPVSVH